MVVLSLIAPPAHAATTTEETLRITAPLAGAFVTGWIDVRAVAPSGTPAVTFERSTDGGSTWTLIRIDADGSDGWSARWDSRGFDGPALLRASVTVPAAASHTVRVTVDNTRPGLTLTRFPSPFSPNGDGRKDRLTIRMRSSEAVAITLRVRDAAQRVRRRWTFAAYSATTRKVIWDGTAGGRVLPDGRYVLSAVASDRAGLQDRAGAAARIDTRRPWLRIGTIWPKLARGSRRTRLRYVARDRAPELRMRLTLRDHAAVVRSSSWQSRPSGRGRWTFSARYRNGKRLFPGAFSLSLRAVDDAGNRAVRSKTRFVHRSMPGRVYTRLSGTGRKVALTFDDCHYSSSWRSILGTLRRHHVRAAFFCPGDRLLLFPQLARMTVRAGHTVASHGWDHSVLPRYGYAGTRWRLLSDRATWIRLGGTTSAPYFRPPYGAYDRSVVAAAGDTSHPRVVMWDVDSGDTSGATGGALVCRVVCRARRGSIILLHTKPATAAALPAIVRGLKSRRLRPVSLARLFRAAGMR